nr:MAG TPA: hypothetical protein [Caudoviricetes sp.]
MTKTRPLISRGYCSLAGQGLGFLQIVRLCV